MPELSRYAVLREAKTHVVGPMCHVLWRWTTGDAVGPNMMTRNSYALNMAYVLPNAPVPIERAMLEANMGGDKKPSFEFFQSGHGKTVIAEVTLTDDAIARVLRTTAADLEALSWAGTHGAVASGMQSVAFTPASAIAAVFAATGQDLGMVGTSSMAHGTGRRVEGGLHASIRFPGLEVGTVGGGTSLPTRARVARADGLRRARARSTASRRSSRRPPSRWRSAPPPRWRPPAPRTSSARISSAAGFAAERLQPGLNQAAVAIRWRPGSFCLARTSPFAASASMATAASPSSASRGEQVVADRRASRAPCRPRRANATRRDAVGRDALQRPREGQRLHVRRREAVGSFRSQKTPLSYVWSTWSIARQKWPAAFRAA